MKKYFVLLMIFSFLLSACASSSSAKQNSSIEISNAWVRTVDANGVSAMHEVDEIDIPTGGMAKLKPGGYHVMLMGLKRNLMEGDMATSTLTFQNAGIITLEAPVKKP